MLLSYSAADDGSRFFVALLLVIIGIFAVIILVWWFSLQWIMAQKLRQPTVDDLLRFNESRIKENSPVPEPAFHRALARAMALAYYGHSIGSMNQVSAFDMSGKPEYQNMQRQVEVINNLLQRRELPQTLAMARECLVAVAPTIEKYKFLNVGNSHHAWVEIGEVLNDVATAETIARLERRFRRSTVMLKPAIAWGLCIAYSRRHDERGKQMKAWLLNAVPYCKPFQNTE